MTEFLKIFKPFKISNDFVKRFCFLNNVRSKYLTVILIACALLFAFYDIKILQKTQPFDVFLFHFKSDLVFLVLSFVFALFIFFNQVKTHKDIHAYHKYIHGIIAIIILCWSVMKSVVFIKYSNGNYNIALVCILLTGLIYIFPSTVHLMQLIFTIFFALVASLIFNLTLSEIIQDIYILIIISGISYIASRYLLHMHLKIFLKEKELVKYRRRINFKS